LRRAPGMGRLRRRRWSRSWRSIRNRVRGQQAGPTEHADPAGGGHAQLAGRRGGAAPLFGGPSCTCASVKTRPANYLGRVPGRRVAGPSTTCSCSLVIFKYFARQRAASKADLVLGRGRRRGDARRVHFLPAPRLLHRFHFLNYVFGAFLIYTGGRKLLFHKDDDTVQSGRQHRAPSSGRAATLRTTNEYDGDRFTLVKDGVRYVTPLFLVLLVIEVF